MTSTETPEPVKEPETAQGPALNPTQNPAQDPADGPASVHRTDDFTVRLEEVFQGPLDLLLHLVKEQEVEIQDVRLADVAQAYMQHVQALQDLDIEVAGEYLVIAATLLAIKSRSLLPREEIELEDDLDPQDELIQRLIEYRRFKGASDDLEDRFHRRALEHARGYRREVHDNEPERSYDLGEVTTWDLLATFSRLMRETLAGRPHTIRSDPRPLRWYVQTIGNAVRANRSGTSLRQLVDAMGDVPSREGLVGAFCALLELMKIGLISARQEQQTDEIVLEWSAPPGSAEDLEDLIRASRFMDEDSEELDEALDGDSDRDSDGDSEEGAADPSPDPGSEAVDQPESAPEDDDDALQG